MKERPVDIKVPKELRNKIKEQAAKKNLTMVELLWKVFGDN